MGATNRRIRDESGASLILALVFLIVIGLLVISLASLTAADLRNTVSFAFAQNETAAADATATIAIQTARSSFDATSLNAPTPVSCSPSGVSSAYNTLFSAYCSTRWQPFSTVTRLLTVSVCPSGIAALDCATSPFLQVRVSFDDYPGSNSNASCLPGYPLATTLSTCGSQMKLDSWAFGVSPPQVSSAVASSCSQPVTITGTGFTSASTVSFVSQSGYPQNQIYESPSVSWGGSTSLQATPPPQLSAISSPNASQYFVVVSGPTGTSVWGSGANEQPWSC